MKYSHLAAALALAACLAGAAPAAQRGPITAPVDPELEKKADHDLAAARFYATKRKAYAGAKDRLLGIVADYPDFTQIDEVYYLLGECFAKTKSPANARAYLEKLLAERPDSKFVERARALLAELPPAAAATPAGDPAAPAPGAEPPTAAPAPTHP